MDYVVNLTVPAITAKASAVFEELRIPHGEINQVRVFFPPGCASLVHGRILVDDAQVYPSNLGSWYMGDGLSLVINDQLFLREAHQTVRFEGYNEDDTYQHVITFGLTVLPEIAAGQPAGIPKWLWRLLRR